MSTTKIPTEAAEQNSIMNSLIGKVTEWFSRSPGSIQSDLDLDEMFTLLSNPRRRTIIRLLSDVEGEITISELAARLAAVEEGVDRSDLPDDARKRVYISCYQTHVPTLAEKDIVSVDDDRSVVTPSEGHAALLAVLEKTDAMVQ